MLFHIHVNDTKRERQNQSNFTKKLAKDLKIGPLVSIFLPNMSVTSYKAPYERDLSNTQHAAFSRWGYYYDNHYERSQPWIAGRYLRLVTTFPIYKMPRFFVSESLTLPPRWTAFLEPFFAASRLAFWAQVSLQNSIAVWCASLASAGSPKHRIEKGA